MAADSSLERTVNKILDKTKDEILSGLRESLEESCGAVAGSLPMLEREYERLIGDGRKEADKLEKQLVGSSDLEARNKQLVLVEKSIGRVFAEAVRKIRAAKRDETYSTMLLKMLEEATKTLRTTNVTVFTNSKDKRLVQKSLSAMPNAQLSPDTIECMGGVVVKSSDGLMTFDNTIDARLERMKPLIRKEIAARFGVGG